MSFVADLKALVAASVDHRHFCPEGWTRVPLGSVATIINGFAFKSGGFGSVGYPVIRIRDVARGFTNTCFNGPAPEGCWVEAGELVVGMDGDFQSAFWRSDRALLNQRVCKVVPDESRVDRRYLAYVLPGYLELINANTPSVTVKHLSSRTLASIPLPLPPIIQQRRIADRIDELFAEIDDGEAALARTRDDLATWRKTLLKAAVTGELTADWRAANSSTKTAASLLARNNSVRPRLGGERRSFPRITPEAAAEVDNVGIPSNWARASFDQLFEVLSDNRAKVKERDYLREGRFPVVDQGARPISGYSNDETMVRHPDRPWILFGDHTRRFKYVEYPFCVGADGIKIMRPCAGVDSQFAFRMLQAATFEDRGYSRHFQFVRALGFLLPPPAEQGQIAALLTEALGHGDALHAEALELSVGSATLRQSILAAAFSGELA